MGPPHAQSPDELEAEKQHIIALNAAALAAAGVPGSKGYRAPRPIPMPPAPVALFAIEVCRESQRLRQA